MELERIRVTDRNMSALATSIGAFAREKDALPPALSALGGGLDLHDGWGNPIRYIASTTEGREPKFAFALVSPGSDGIFQPATLSLLEASASDVDDLRERALNTAIASPRRRQPWYEATRADYIYLGSMKISGYSLGSNTALIHGTYATTN